MGTDFIKVRVHYLLSDTRQKNLKILNFLSIKTVTFLM